MQYLWRSAQLMLVFGLAAACGSDDSENVVDDGNNGSGGRDVTVLDGGNGDAGDNGTEGDVTAGGAGNRDPDTGDCPLLPLGEEGCVGEIFAPENLPLDIYMMFDRSGTMLTQPTPESPTRMAMVRNALYSFLEDPESDGIGFGIGYFGSNDLRELELVSCDPADYTTPDVPIGVLPTNAEAMMASLDNVEAMSETPTGAALEGACEYTQGWKSDHGGHAVVILLVTDGEPEAPWTSGQADPESEDYCNPTLEDAQDAAAACLNGMPSVPIYVLGVGPLLENLNQIAEAGGTEAAYLVEDESSAEILEALNAIRGAATVPCEFPIPPAPAGELLDFNQVNLVYMDAACQQHTVYNVEDEAGCDGQSGGWYYDDPASPNTILLCAASCENVAVPGVQLYYSIGCGTLVE